MGRWMGSWEQRGFGRQEMRNFALNVDPDGSVFGNGEECVGKATYRREYNCRLSLRESSVTFAERKATEAFAARKATIGPMRQRSLITCSVVCLLLWTAYVQAGDWPQMLGPHRNGEAVGEPAWRTWTKPELTSLWKRPVGSGFAGVAVSKGTVVLFHRIEERELVEALDALTGRNLWKSDFPAKYSPSYTEDDGPRAVPVVDRNRVYAYGAQGDLRCLDLPSGKEIWGRNLFEEFNSKNPSHGEPPEGYFGFASSPLVEGDRILVNAGGDAKRSGIVAFAADTGKLLWQATGERASYASPVAVTVGGVRHVIFVTRLNVVSLNPEDGSERFRFPFGKLGPTVNAANPVVFDEHLLVTASYGIGAALAKIGPDGASVVWRDRDILASQYTTCVEKDGILYGIHGRQDGPPAELRCFDPMARKILWSEPSFGYATLLRNGDRFLAIKTDGELVLAAVNPNKYEELARSRVTDATIRALPALSDGRLFVRDTNALRCVDLR
ncbi:MAG: PQQ-binding-like beta-propeller repeat protein [Thermoguttaceae bacterium]